MLGKLMKYEFKATGRIMLPGLGALIVLAGLTYLTMGNLTAGSPFLASMSGIIMLLFYIGLVAAAMLAVAVMVLRFYRSLMKDEGYLTLSLPVSVHSLVWSKLLVSLTWAVVTAAVHLGVFFLSFSRLMQIADPDGTYWRAFIGELWTAMRSTPIPSDQRFMIAVRGGLLLADLLLSVCASFLRFFAAISLGHCFNKGKLLLSVVFYLLLSIVINQLDLLWNELLTALWNADFFWSLAANCVQMLVWSALLYFATVLPLQKRVNLS